MRKVNICDEGGFVKLQTTLLNDHAAEIKCKACLHLLTKTNYQAADLKKNIDAVVSGEKDPKSRFANSEGASAVSVVEADLGINKKRKKGEAAKLKSKEGGGPEGQDVCAEWMRSYDPYVELLPVGSYGKKCPYRCVACKTRYQPLGKVGELASYKLYQVQHFISTHCEAPTHQQNVMKIKSMSGDREDVPCEGLDVFDEDCGGRLYVHRKIVALWGAFSDLQQMAKHQYWMEANSGHWFVRASDCEKTTKKSYDYDRSVCGACLSLGAAASVPGSMNN